MPLRSLWAVPILVALVASPTAEAGRRPYLWVYDTETVAQGDVELEQWLWARTLAPANPAGASTYWIWWGPVIGLTSSLELALPFQVSATRSRTWLDSFEADLRWRVFSRNDDGKFQPLVRAAFHQSIHAPGEPPRVELNLVGSYGAPEELHVTVDIGGRLFLPGLAGMAGPSRVMATYAAGVALPLSSSLRISAEVFGELDVLNPPTGSDVPHHFAGASISWTRGRLWITAGTLVGLTPLAPFTPQFMPRLIWAVAL